jgi:hypothetical protein
MIIELSDLVTSYSSLNEKKIIIGTNINSIFFNLTDSIDGCTTSLINTSQAIPKEKTTNLNYENGNLLKLLIS